MEKVIRHTEVQDAGQFAIPVEGMTCAACALRIERKLNKLEGVSQAGVSYATEEALIEVDSEKAKLSDLVEVIRQTGYDVNTAQAETRFEGSKAEESSSELKAVLQQTNGVINVEVVEESYTREVSIRYVPGMLSGKHLSALINQYRPAGKSVSEIDSEESHSLNRAALLMRRLVVGTALSIPLAILAMSHGSFDIPYDHWIQLILATPVVLYSGRPFFDGAFKALKHGAADMNTLVALGVAAAYGYSVWAVVSTSLEMPLVYFEAAALIVVFILFGRYLEEKAKGRTGEAIRMLKDLQPKTARVLRDGEMVEIPADEVILGERVRILAGERISVDGFVVEGQSAVDESMMTGEPLPVSKSTGSRIVAGTLNTNGVLEVEVSRTGPDTVLSQIARLVSRAQASKAPIQQLADRIAAVFVPVVLFIATLTGIVWWVMGPEPAFSTALLRFVAVLIIACPCALGLATPTAIVVGTGRAARNGILIKNAAALQRLSDVTVLALDKTGTLTEGRPAVGSILSLAQETESEILALASAVEQHSEHPLAEAVNREAAARDLTLPQASAIEILPGQGIRAQVEGMAVLLGNERLMHEAGITIPEFSDTSQGETQVLIARNGHVVGCIFIGDTIRSESAEAVRTLKDQNVRVVMLTGDRGASAQRVADELGIGEVHSNLLPEHKVAVLEELKGRGETVSMIGDGINDAPALAMADVGFAVRSGSDIAYEASDITLMTSDLRLSGDALVLAGATMRIIRQNLFFAFVYNVICIPVAAGALYPAFGILLSPVLASAAMALSSVSVVTNSLRLKRMKIK